MRVKGNFVVNDILEFYTYREITYCSTRHSSKMVRGVVAARVRTITQPKGDCQSRLGVESIHNVALWRTYTGDAVSPVFLFHIFAAYKNPASSDAGPLAAECQPL